MPCIALHMMFMHLYACNARKTRASIASSLWEESAPANPVAFGTTLSNLRNHIAGTAPNYQQYIASLVQALYEHCMGELRPFVYHNRHASGRAHTHSWIDILPIHGRPC
jgi:hypothetical protein